MHEGGGWELPGKRRGREFATDHEEASRFSSSKLILLSLFYSYLPSEPPPERASTIWALHLSTSRQAHPPSSSWRRDGADLVYPRSFFFLLIFFSASDVKQEQKHPLYDQETRIRTSAIFLSLDQSLSRLQAQVDHTFLLPPSYSPASRSSSRNPSEDHLPLFRSSHLCSLMPTQLEGSRDCWAHALQEGRAQVGEELRVVLRGESSVIPLHCLPLGAK